MSRSLCQQCLRPTKACICQFIVEVDNAIPVIVLQHPKEVNHTKGTASLLEKSLTQCQIIVGENFTDNETLNEVLSNYNPFVLYPSKQAFELPIVLAEHSKTSQMNIASNEVITAQKKPCLLILDGTWKKAYRMLMLSKNLQALQHICLPETLASQGQYLIRKVAKANALSSLEATCYGLALLDSNLTNKEFSHTLEPYQALLDKFVAFNQFQLSFRS